MDWHVIELEDGGVKLNISQLVDGSIALMIEGPRGQCGVSLTKQPLSTLIAILQHALQHVEER